MTPAERPKRYEYRGQLLTLAQLAKLAGVEPRTFRARLRVSGMTIEEAMNFTFNAKGRRYEFRGQRITLEQIAKITGRSKKWARRRILDDKVIEAMRPHSDPKSHPRWRVYTYAGLKGTLADWAARTRLPYGTIYYRVHTLGMPIEEALKEIARKHVFLWPLKFWTELTFDGTTQPISEWALDYGITPAVIIARLERGLSIEEAITKPMVVARGQRLPSSKRRGASQDFPPPLGTGVGSTARDLQSKKLNG